MPPRLERLFSACRLPSLTKPLLGETVAKTASTVGMSPSHGVTSGQDIPVPTTVSPKKEGGGGVWKCKNQHCFGENSFFQRCGAVKEAQPAGNSSPGESSCPSLSLLLLQGGLGTKNLLGTASCSLPSCAAGTGAQLAPGCILGFPPPRSLTALGTQTEVSVTAGAGTGAATKGLGRWHSSGTGQLLMWVSSCLPAARPTAPLDVLCHLQTQRQARIQLGPRPPGRAGLSSCGTAGAQERRDSGVGKEGGLDKDNARLHQAGAPTALAASPCQWRGLGSFPCAWDHFAQAHPCI